jgi:signal transduction histidine kinase
MSTAEELEMSSTTIALDPSARASREAHALFDAERLRIARELHDVVAYSFATISVQAGVAAHLADERPEVAADALRTIKEISGEASRELRAILGALRHTAGADRPRHGVAAFDTLAATTSSAGLPTRVVVSGSARSLPPAVDRAAYRIAQEALTNALRHAGPASAVVTARYEPGRVVIEVRDDGRGPTGSDREREPDRGHGIAGMRERALALGGEFEAGSHPLGGFRVRAYLPVGVQS